MVALPNAFSEDSGDNRSARRFWGILRCRRKSVIKKLFALDRLSAGKRRGHQEGVVEHKGIGFNVVQSVRRGHYVWTTQTDPPKCAEAPGKDVAIKNAQRSIDIWLRAAKRTKQPQ